VAKLNDKERQTIATELCQAEVKLAVAVEDFLGNN